MLAPKSTPHCIKQLKVIQSKTPTPLDLCFYTIFFKNILGMFSIHNFLILKIQKICTIMLKTYQIYVILKNQIVFCVFLLFNYMLKTLIT
jgi:hypothetical protein